MNVVRQRGAAAEVSYLHDSTVAASNQVAVRKTNHRLTKRDCETIMVALWLEIKMPTTLTLKNIPDALYERLKASAQTHRRSLNSEAIVCLESVLLPGRLTPSERIIRAREFRSALPKGKFQPRDIDSLKREGRQ